MAVTKEKKKELLQDLDDKFGKAQAVYFADYRGLSVKDMGSLRSQLRENGVDFRVAKKTLMQLSLKNSNLPEAPSEVMAGPVGAAFGYEDVIAAVKALHTFSKTNDNLKILGGLVEGKFITQAEALELAQLPSREELLAKLVGSMKAPVSGFYGVTSGMLRGLIQVLKAYGEQKPEAPVEEKKEEAPAEEAKTEEKAPEEAPKEEAKAEEAKTEEAAPAEEKPAEEGDKPEENSAEEST